MVLLLYILLLFYPAVDSPQQLLPAIEFSAIKQDTLENQGCIALFSREIKFRIRNRSDKAIYIHILKAEKDFLPLGSLIRHVDEGDQWVNPWDKSTPRSYKEVGFPEHDVYTLQPGKSIKFNDLAGDSYVGGKLKRYIYISLNPDEEPQIATSQEFILR